MSTVSLNDKIPNNVDLSSDKRLQRALEQWQPGFLEWWREMGPDGFQACDVYLRTAISVDSSGWAHFGHVKMPDYRWGIFLADPEGDRRIGFGDHLGEPAWKEVPGEYRNPLRRLIVTQGDTEPASVEQQRGLGKTCPSLYDLRNLFQVNVEEGRHLWAMVYLLHSYFGRDGREEAEALLERRSGNPDRPRILQAFNEPIEDWLSFFMFTTFTDRDGKYQLLSLAESAFDPLSRTCRFMLTEEAHHMFVGQTGIGRVIQRTVDLVRAGKDPSANGAIPLEMLQRYLNFWYTVSLDLFGSEVSTNGASYFGGGLKGRPKEERFADHRLLDGAARVELVEDGQVVEREVKPRLAVNLETRSAYQEDCQSAVDKWNKLAAGVGFEFRLPSPRFHRGVGAFAGLFFDPAGHRISETEFLRREPEFLPSEADQAYVRGLMAGPVTEPRRFANWIAAPARGIDGRPVDFEYVRWNEA
ncbi:MAG: benzoyl-CoA 2,3-epoxidase subunit BoxB [Deltaproteobacteria bacterium]|nr:benzoyl-CoA 2,3-epoxidase subunit BoxB [Deltaproteobacteria bacterium]